IPPPRAFSELPPDRADSPPKQAGLLSNVTRRAPDRVPGGDANLPRTHGEADASLVHLESGAPSRPPVPPRAPAAPEPAAPRTAALQRSDSPAHDPPADTSAQAGSRAGRAGDVIRVTPPGSSDFRQPEMDSDVNAGLSG